MKLRILFAAIALLGGSIFSSVYGQTNLLQNPKAASGKEGWRPYANATVEDYQGNAVFTVRNGANFSQDILLNASDAGKFALLIGRASGERVNDGTDLPALSGYMMEPGKGSAGRIKEYLVDQRMVGHPKEENQWVVLYGVYRIPEGTGQIRLLLVQGEVKDVPHNGSAARFDDLGVFLFDTEEDAIRFAGQY